MAFDRDSHRALVALGIVLALLALALWQVGRVRPPTHFRLATGPEGAQSNRMAQRYAGAAGERGYSVEVVPTRGSVQIIELLQQGEAEAGFLDNTSALQRDLTGIAALTAVYPEPLWIFYPDEADDQEPFDSLSDLHGRISIGEVNSGGNELARLLFQLSEVGPEQAQLIALPDDVAAGQLLSGDLDAVIIAGGIDSDPVIQLLTSPDVELLDLRQIEALKIVAPFLGSVTLPEGVIRLKENRPDEDKRLLATQAVLAVREDLHADLQRLLLTVAEQEHERHRWFEAPGEFPTQDNVAIDLSPTAVQFYQGAPSYLERYLPFWIASPLERFYLLILPLMVLLYPLVRNTPSVYGRVMRRRIYRYYSTVREVELGIQDYTIAELDEQIARLTRMGAQLAQTIHVPTGYLERYYSLRLHIRLVLDDLRDRKQELLSQPPSSRDDGEGSQQSSIVQEPDPN